MGLSTNTLIHQTDFNSLRNILIGKRFKVSYSLECLRFNNLEVKFAFPMVSFSDIPFSQLSEHLGRYGKFMIVMSKEWGRRNNMNPVCYYDSKASVTEFFINEIQNTDSTNTGFLKLFSYAKNYEGPLSTSNKEYRNYRFSDEREWRYIAPENESIKYIDGDRYSANKELFQSGLNSIDCNSLYINFEGSDIKYIVVNEDSQIEKFEKILYKSLSNSDEVNRIPIFTSKQVKNDFLGEGHNKEV